MTEAELVLIVIRANYWGDIALANAAMAQLRAMEARDEQI